MSISSMASFSPPAQFSTSSTSSHPKPHVIIRPFISISPKTNFILSTLKVSAADNGVGTTVELVEPVTPQPSPPVQEKLDSSVRTSGSSTAVADEVKMQISNFEDPRWVGGTWDLKQFQKNDKTDWDAVIDAGMCHKP